MAFIAFGEGDAGVDGGAAQPHATSAKTTMIQREALITRLPTGIDRSSIRRWLGAHVFTATGADSAWI